MLLHQCYEISLGEQLWGTRLSIYHLNSRRLELGALFIHWNQLQLYTTHTHILFGHDSTKAG